MGTNRRFASNACSGQKLNVNVNQDVMLSLFDKEVGYHNYHALELNAHNAVNCCSHEIEFMKINEIILLIKYTSGVVKMYSFH